MRAGDGLRVDQLALLKGLAQESSDRFSGFNGFKALETGEFYGYPWGYKS